MDTTLLLLRNGALTDVNVADKRGITPLHNSCYSNNLDIVQYLVSKGANVQAKDHRVRCCIWLFGTYTITGNVSARVGCLERQFSCGAVFVTAWCYAFYNCVIV